MMKRSISMLVTALMFSAAIAPNAMAHMHNSNVPVILSSNAAASPEQSASDSTKPLSSDIEVSPAPATTTTPDNITTNTEKSRLNVNRPNADNYPAYCPPLPPGTQPDDWEYREALNSCLYGN